MATSHKSSSHAKSDHSSHSKHTLSTEDRKKMSDSKYAFPKERKEPINDASHVRDALARFDQVKGVSDTERKQAFGRIKSAAKKFGVDVKESNWKELGKKPHTTNSSHKKAS